MINTRDYDFDTVIQLLRASSTGRLIESFIRVEYGESFLKSAWDAFLDIGDFFDEQFTDELAMINQFVLMLDDEADVKSMGLPVCL